jgi:SAM-dependent methyltransferase
LSDIVPADGTVRMLDFGCGSGTFTARLLQRTGWQPEGLALTLVEPVESVRRQAVARLAAFTASPAANSATLPAGLAGSFDFVLANHCLYYVPDLRGQLAKLIEALSAGGVFATAIAARTNALIEFWIVGFELLGRTIPYHTSEEVEAALEELGADYKKQQVAYELTFTDTLENRLRIVRFLLAEYLAEMPQRPLLELFDRYSHSGRVNIRTASDHYAVHARGNKG